MSDAMAVIRYDGPALAGHEIDVQELAPALLALADMVQFTNRRFNGEAATMKVTVSADVKQQCFMLQIHLAQSILESAKTLFSTDGYKTAKEIAETIDLVFPSCGVGGGVFWLWKRFSGKAGTPSLSEMKTEQRGGITVINNFCGDGGKAEMPTAVFDLATDPEMIALGKRVMAPLERPGYDNLSFQNRGKPVVEIDKDDATAFRAASASKPAIDPIDPSDAVRTPIRGRASIITRCDEGRSQWGLKWTGRTERVNMPDDWLIDYQAGRIDIPVGSWLDVTVEMTTSRTDPAAQPTFKVLTVHEVIPPSPSQQSGMFDDE